MKKLIQTLIFICPLFLFGQDTVSYWHSTEKAIEINNLKYGKLLKVHEVAPNGEVYNIYCKGVVNCFDKYNDAEMVWMTIDGKIIADAKVKINSKPERPEWLIHVDSIPPDTIINYYGIFSPKDIDSLKRLGVVVMSPDPYKGDGVIYVDKKSEKVYKLTGLSKI